MAKIFVVDDDQVYCQMVQYWLEQQGYEIEVCENGGKAFDKMQEENYDMVLIDYFLPTLLGDEVCERIRENENYRTKPIVIMTSFTDYTVDYFKQKGATDVIYKPIDKQALIEKVAEFLPI
ncbi:MAG: response regulator [Candidatus Omnitrophota bacterium]